MLLATLSMLWSFNACDSPPNEEGFISESDIVADLKELVCDDKIGRRNTTDITLFKSVGTALEDLAAATLILQNAWINDI